jgi:hypothetical protein
MEKKEKDETKERIWRWVGGTKKKWVASICIHLKH